MYFYAVIGIVISYSQVNAQATGSTPSGQIPLNEFKDANVRQFVEWIGKLSQSIENLWPTYADQMLLQSEIALRLTEYADAITADTDFNQACITEQRKKYTKIKNQAISDYSVCNQSQALHLLADFTVATQNAWQQLRELDKRLTSMSSRCQISTTTWFLSSLINMIRELCTRTNQASKDRDLKNLRDTTLVELYRKALSITLDSGKQVQACISKTSENAIKVIQTNIQDVAKCITS